MEMAGKENQTKESLWMLYVDGSSNSHNGGTGVWQQGLDRMEIEFLIRLAFSVTNNEAEYEALIASL